MTHFTTAMVKLLRKAGVAAFWILIWYAAYAVVGKSVLLPSPADTARALISLVPNASFWLSVLFSLIRIIAGFALGTAAGVVLGALTASFRWARELFSPLVSTVAATPVASFIILALVWLRVGVIPVFTSFLIVMPVVCSNIAAGINAADSGLLEMANAFGVGKIKTITGIYIPTVKPYLFAAVSTSVGMAWKAGIAAEVLCSPVNSIGGKLYDSKIYLDTPSLFAWTVVVVVLSVILGILIKYLVRRADGEGSGK